MILPKHIHCRQRLITIGQFNAADVLPHINTHAVRKEYIVNNKSYIVKMNSARYKIFSENSKCVACGLKGKVFLLEKHKEVDKKWKYVSAHFNLYGIENDVLIMLTKDHIKPKSKGGRDNIVNYQTMCEVCNALKKDEELDNETIGRLRAVYNSFANFGL